MCFCSRGLDLKFFVRFLEACQFLFHLLAPRSFFLAGRLGFPSRCFGRVQFPAPLRRQTLLFLRLFGAVAFYRLQFGGAFTQLLFQLLIASFEPGRGVALALRLGAPDELKLLFKLLARFAFLRQCGANLRELILTRGQSACQLSILRLFPGQGFAERREFGRNGLESQLQCIVGSLRPEVRWLRRR